MASPSIWEDMEESFFICSVCLDNFKDPKLLPCLHRYCRHCLAPIVEQHRGEFSCPLCKSVCIIPDEGVDGFKTDFHMRSILEFITLQKSVTTEESQTCKGCQKKEKVVAYCFKCKGFLCNQWYQFHLNNSIVQDHKDYVLPLQDIVEKKLSLQKLASLTQAPRCHVHVEKLAEVCCETCRNLAICMICSTHGKHKNHRIHDVKDLAIKERKNIQKVVATLDKYKENIHNMPKRLEKAKKQLDRNLAGKKGKLHSQYREKLEKIGEMLKEVDDLLEKNKGKIDEKERKDLVDLEEKRGKELGEAAKKINEKYDQLVDEVKGENEAHRQDQEKIFGEKRAIINRKLGFLDKEFKDIDKSINMQGEQGLERLTEISGKSESRIQRFDNLMSTVSGILASNDDWIDSQCLPDISSASGLLTEDVKKEFSELESLPEITISDLPLVVDKVKIAEEAESVLEINVIRREKALACTMAADGDGRIAITGKASSEQGGITVVDTKGKLVWQNMIENLDKTIKNPYCYSESLSPYRIVTACNFHQIRINDFRDGSAISINNVSDVIGDWQKEQVLTCITVDQLNKDVFVGRALKADIPTPCRDVLVFDNKLNYRHTLVLPGIIGWPRDLTFHKGNLVVCDAVGKIAYAVTINGQNTELVHQFIKPDRDGRDWYPIRVCTDNKDFIYMLWEARIGDTWRRILTQYSQDGLHLLTTKAVDDGAFCLTAMFIDGREKLLVTTFRTGKIHIYNLVDENP